MSGITTDATELSTYNSRTVVIEVTGVRHEAMRSSHYTVKVPYNRMSQAMQRIRHMGGKITSITIGVSSSLCETKSVQPSVEATVVSELVVAQPVVEESPVAEPIVEELALAESAQAEQTSGLTVAQLRTQESTQAESTSEPTPAKLVAEEPTPAKLTVAQLVAEEPTPAKPTVAKLVAEEESATATHTTQTPKTSKGRKSRRKPKS